MITYHLVPKTYYESCDPNAPYKPGDFDKDGFIHCTDGIDNVVEIGDRYYKDRAGAWLLLVIERTKVDAPVRYEDPERLYPHIYGALNRDAIVEVVPIERAPDGTFLPPAVQVRDRE